MPLAGPVTLSRRRTIIVEVRVVIVQSPSKLGDPNGLGVHPQQDGDRGPANRWECGGKEGGDIGDHPVAVEPSPLQHVEDQALAVSSSPVNKGNIAAASASMSVR